jgi:hypothetical protein
MHVLHAPHTHTHTHTHKTRGSPQKRSLTIRDDSGRSVELTLWGKYANEPGDHLFSVRRGVSVRLGVEGVVA